MIQNRIREDLNKSIKEKDESAISVLRMLVSAVQEKEKKKRYLLSKEDSSGNDLDLKSRLSEEEIMEVIASEIKKRKESIKEFEKGNRKDLVRKEEKEAEILLKYLPEQISADDLAEIIKKTIEETGARDRKDIGKVMSKVMPAVKGRADGSEVGRLVNEFLS